jgi:AcrR family transcriptional regulator
MPAPSYRDYRLPSGRHTLGAEQVAANQRLRLIGAASDLLAEVRLVGLSARLIAERAGVSGHTFYEHFENVDALLTAAFASAAKLLVELTARDRDGAKDPERARRQAIGAAVALGGQEPGLTALMRLEVAVAVPAVGVERERLLSRLSSLECAREKPPIGRVATAAALALAVQGLESGGRQVALGRELAAGVSWWRTGDPRAGTP